MISRKYRLLSFIFILSFIGILTGCANNRTNSQFTVRVTGSASDLEFDGQCTAQKAKFLSKENVAQSLDVKGTVVSVSQSQDFETTGFFIYCSIANQSTSGRITVELLLEGNLVASAQSTSPDMPATLEFGDKP